MTGWWGGEEREGGKGVGEVTDEGSVELWLVGKSGRIHAVAAEGEQLQNAAFIRRRWRGGMLNL